MLKIQILLLIGLLFSVDAACIASEPSDPSAFKVGQAQEKHPGQTDNKTESKKTNTQSSSAFITDTPPANIQPQSDQHFAHSNERSSSDSTVEKWSTGVTAFATAVMAWFTFSLARSTERLWNAGEKALETTERAFVFLDGFNYELSTMADSSSAINPAGSIDPNLHVTRFAVQPRWKNGGNTPTKNMRITVNWRPPGESLPFDFPYGYDNIVIDLFVAPQAVEPSEFIEMGGANEIINNGVGRLGFPPMMFIWGRADYEDIFGKSHFVQWCYYPRFTWQPGERLRVSFIQWGNYNQSDEDGKSSPS